MWENLLHANQMDCVTHFSCFFFFKLFSKKILWFGEQYAQTSETVFAGSL